MPIFEKNTATTYTTPDTTPENLLPPVTRVENYEDSSGVSKLAVTYTDSRTKSGEITKTKIPLKWSETSGDKKTNAQISKHVKSGISAPQDGGFTWYRENIVSIKSSEEAVKQLVNEYKYGPGGLLVSVTKCHQEGDNYFRDTYNFDFQQREFVLDKRSLHSSLKGAIENFSLEIPINVTFKPPLFEGDSPSAKFSQRATVEGKTELLKTAPESFQTPFVMPIQIDVPRPVTNSIL